VVALIATPASDAILIQQGDGGHCRRKSGGCWALAGICAESLPPHQLLEKCLVELQMTAEKQRKGGFLFSGFKAKDGVQRGCKQ
jgi:hypothetical protein